MKNLPQVPVGTFVITSICRESDGTVSCSGSVSAGTLQRVWGKIVAGPCNPAQHLHPWDATPPDPKLGSAGASWSISQMPTGGNTNCDLLVWGAFDGEADFSVPSNNALNFNINAIDSCGSGSGSGSAVDTRFREAGCSAVVGTTFDVLPRVYLLTFDVHSLDLWRLGAQFLLEGMLCSSAVHLTYDERISTPRTPVWRAPSLADANSHWTLRLQTRGACVEAELSLQQISVRQVLPALQWHNRNFRLTAENHLIQAPSQSAATTPLRMRIRPA